MAAVDLLRLTVDSDELDTTRVRLEAGCGARRAATVGREAPADRGDHRVWITSEMAEDSVQDLRQSAEKQTETSSSPRRRHETTDSRKLGRPDHA